MSSHFLSEFVTAGITTAQFILGYVVLYFIAMLIFNMAVDILDNYNDYHHATEVHDYKEKTNIIGREQLSLPFVFRLMIGMIVVSAVMGIVLAYFVGWPLFWMGLLLLLDWYLLLIRSAAFIEFTAR